MKRYSTDSQKLWKIANSFNQLELEALQQSLRDGNEEEFEEVQKHAYLLWLRLWCSKAASTEQNEVGLSILLDQAIYSSSSTTRRSWELAFPTLQTCPLLSRGISKPFVYIFEPEVNWSFTLDKMLSWGNVCPEMVRQAISVLFFIRDDYLFRIVLLPLLASLSKSSRPILALDDAIRIFLEQELSTYHRKICVGIKTFRLLSASQATHWMREILCSVRDTIAEPRDSITSGSAIKISSAKAIIENISISCVFTPNKVNDVAFSIASFVNHVDVLCLAVEVFVEFWLRGSQPNNADTIILLLSRKEVKKYDRLILEGQSVIKPCPADQHFELEQRVLQSTARLANVTDHEILLPYFDLIILPILERKQKDNRAIFKEVIQRANQGQNTFQNASFEQPFDFMEIVLEPLIVTATAPRARREHVSMLMTGLVKACSSCLKIQSQVDTLLLNKKAGDLGVSESKMQLVCAWACNDHASRRLRLIDRILEHLHVALRFNIGDTNLIASLLKVLQDITLSYLREGEGGYAERITAQLIKFAKDRESTSEIFPIVRTIIERAYETIDASDLLQNWDVHVVAYKVIWVSISSKKLNDQARTTKKLLDDFVCQAGSITAALTLATSHQMFDLAIKPRNGSTCVDWTNEEVIVVCKELLKAIQSEQNGDKRYFVFMKVIAYLGFFLSHECSPTDRQKTLHFIETHEDLFTREADRTWIVMWRAADLVAKFRKSKR